VTVIRWTLQAAADLEAIHEYVGRDSGRYASLLVERLIGAIEPLARFPELGRTVPEYDRPDIREIIQGSYRVVYRLRGDAVEVLTVFHGARLFPVDLEGAL